MCTTLYFCLDISFDVVYSTHSIVWSFNIFDTVTGTLGPRFAYVCELRIILVPLTCYPLAKRFAFLTFVISARYCKKLLFLFYGSSVSVAKTPAVPDCFSFALVVFDIIIDNNNIISCVPQYLRLLSTY